jgi:hypothetical protein
MAGLYPDDQIISLFGKEVRWPRLDPSTGKFTNGSFSDPLVEPSFIPVETINLILDNLESLITGMGKTPNSHGSNQLFEALQNFLFPVGVMTSVYPDEPTPVERGWPGDWEIWSARAIMYGVSPSAPPSFVNYYNLAGTSITAGSTPVVCYHKAGDDFRLYRFIAQSSAYSVPAELDPVKWTYLQPGAIDERQKCGNLLTEEDYEIGDTITSGTHTGKYVTEIIVPGGKFTGIEGGFRPTFIYGGVQDGRIKNIAGTFGAYYRAHTGTGVFSTPTASSPNGGNVGNVTLTDNGVTVYFSADRVVPTGPDFAGTNLSTRLWRKVSDFAP